ncbi:MULTISPECIES: flavin reductase [Brevibacterium]|nr:flavin reductase [Brevibacterium casei]MCT2358707.1 flavin reductase [Brevibacterium casei]NJE66955.1 flavin reductase [Brevibacterium sp. LS14]
MQQTHDTALRGVKQTITDAWHAVWDSDDLDAFDSLVTDDYVRVSTNSGQAKDAQAIKDEIREIRSAFPDLTTTIDHILIEGDEGAIYWHSVGTFTEPMGDVPPTGQQVTTHGSNLITLRGSRIAREEVTWDAHELLADLGLKSLSSAFEAGPEDVVTDDLSGRPSADSLKAFNRQFITGVTVVTTTDDEGKPRGLAVNSYNSVSLDPPLVLVCVQKTSSTYPALFRSTHMGINIMSRNQRETIGVFASKSPDKFATLDWHAGANGSPLIDGSAASIEVEIKERFQALTHTVFIGRVRSAETSEDSPMIYKAGKFFDSEDLSSLD